MALGFSYFARLDLKQLSFRYLSDLSARLNEMVNLAILDGDELVFVERIKVARCSVCRFVGDFLAASGQADPQADSSVAGLTWFH